MLTLRITKLLVYVSERELNSKGIRQEASLMGRWWNVDWQVAGVKVGMRWERDIHIREAQKLSTFSEREYAEKCSWITLPSQRNEFWVESSLVYAKSQINIYRSRGQSISIILDCAHKEAWNSDVRFYRLIHRPVRIIYNHTTFNLTTIKFKIFNFDKLRIWTVVIPAKWPKRQELKKEMLQIMTHTVRCSKETEQEHRTTSFTRNHCCQAKIDDRSIIYIPYT